MGIVCGVVLLWRRKSKARNAFESDEIHLMDVSPSCVSPASRTDMLGEPEAATGVVLELKSPGSVEAETEVGIEDIDGVMDTGGVYEDSESSMFEMQAGVTSLTTSGQGDMTAGCDHELYDKGN